jgi:hypothetical protein
VTCGKCVLCALVFSCVSGVCRVGMVGSTGGFVWIVIVYSECGVRYTAARTGQPRISRLFVLLLLCLRAHTISAASPAFAQASAVVYDTWVLRKTYSCAVGRLYVNLRCVSGKSVFVSVLGAFFPPQRGFPR